MIGYIAILSSCSTYWCYCHYHQYHLFYTWLSGTFISLLIAGLLCRAIIYTWSMMRPSLYSLRELRWSKKSECRMWKWTREAFEKALRKDETEIYFEEYTKKERSINFVQYFAEFAKDQKPQGQSDRAEWSIRCRFSSRLQRPCQLP